MQHQRRLFLIAFLFVGRCEAARAEAPRPLLGWLRPASINKEEAAPASPLIGDDERYPGSAPAPTTRQRALFQDTKFDATWLGDGGRSGLGMTDLEAATTLSIPVAADVAPLLITPYAAAHSWYGGPATPDLPSELYDLNIELAWRPRLAKWLFADLAVTPGIYTDLNGLRSDSFQWRGRGLAIVALSERLQLAGGLIYVNRIETKLLPAGGVIWSPSDETRFFLVFPQPKISHCFGAFGVTQVWGYVAGEFGGGRWEIERADGRPDSIDYTDCRLLLGVEAVRAQWLKMHFEIGYVFARRVRFRSGTPEYEPQDTIGLRAGIRF